MLLFQYIAFPSAILAIVSCCFAQNVVAQQMEKVYCELGSYSSDTTDTRAVQQYVENKLSREHHHVNLKGYWAIRLGISRGAVIQWETYPFHVASSPDSNEVGHVQDFLIQSIQKHPYVWLEDCVPGAIGHYEDIIYLTLDGEIMSWAVVSFGIEAVPESSGEKVPMVYLYNMLASSTNRKE